MRIRTNFDPAHPERLLSVFLFLLKTSTTGTTSPPGFMITKMRQPRAPILGGCIEKIKNRKRALGCFDTIPADLVDVSIQL
ncbi:hypothetical protein Bcep1808_7426 (plasmid) [Burkholderia vietnamiensis G4]|uniref:Uncharacterized protein n=1 Tax=Burkholderia vietnamiensis (strain G4 / LMG 22486) TaxID=269482 RepID=A4JVK0_BURVG|nr:hypothetical protein Bcep1808_7426 [Burkholderia vietnamiensis G4]